ncbi:MAG: hypothetical protein KDM91_06925 [Verrucomicrobiae bacterium]|nr:hypothetical protein [Verrucomicrobiae bacterium]MCP5540105.1 hypothetical protein [Akkermansiaceae bacterium]
MIYFLLVTVTLAISFVAQEFLPVLEWAYYARMLLVPAAFYCGAVTVPYPVMLILATATGFVWDARYHVPVVPPNADHPELPFGFTIFLFGLMGSLIQGVRPLFRRGRWELPVLMIGICTLASLMIEYLVISFHRGGLFLSPEMWFKMLMTSLFSMLAAPFLLLLFSRLARWSGYRIRLEGITRKYSYGDSV